MQPVDREAVRAAARRAAVERVAERERELEHRAERGRGEDLAGGAGDEERATGRGGGSASPATALGTDRAGGVREASGPARQ